MNKVIAVMEKPKDCQNCVFGVCKYSLPQTNTCIDEILYGESD